MGRVDVDSSSPDAPIGFKSRWGHSQAEGGNDSVSPVRADATHPAFRLELFLGDKRVELKALQDGEAAARLVLMSDRWESYVPADLTSTECEALAAALGQCAEEKRARERAAREMASLAAAQEAQVER